MKELEDLKQQEKELEFKLNKIRSEIRDIEIPTCNHIKLLSYDIVDTWQCDVCEKLFYITELKL